MRGIIALTEPRLCFSATYIKNFGYELKRVNAELSLQRTDWDCLSSELMMAF